MKAVITLESGKIIDNQVVQMKVMVTKKIHNEDDHEEEINADEVVARNKEK